MEEIYEKIMREGYGLQLRHGTRTRTGLVCRTDRGLRELKKPRGSTDSLRLAFDVKKRLRENGLRTSAAATRHWRESRFIGRTGRFIFWRTCCRRGHWRRTVRRPFCRGQRP